MKKDDILKLYQNYRLYIFPAVVIISSFILIIFVIYPQLIKLINNQKISTENINQLKFLETKGQNLENYDSVDLNQKVGYVLSSYPTEKDFVSGIGLLQNLVSQSGFSIISMSLGSGSSNTKAQSYALKLDLSGPTTLIPILFSNIESSPRLMRINNVETIIGKNTSAATISLDIEVLYSSAPTSFGNIDSPIPELSQTDEDVLAKLAKNNTSVSSQQITPQLGPRGKVNPFE